MNKFRIKITNLCSDNSTEYCNESVDKYLKELGISSDLGTLQTLTPYSPPQNGVAERKNRSLVEMAFGNLPC